jgi:hypothetical protein
LGSRLLIKQAGLDKVDLRFDPDGLSCEIVAPLARTTRAAGGRLALRSHWFRVGRGIRARASNPAEVS